MRILPLGADKSSIPNAVRRRKLGLNPIVTRASPLDFTNTLRSIRSSCVTCDPLALPALEFGRPERQAYDLRHARQLRDWTKRECAWIRAARAVGCSHHLALTRRIILTR